MIRGNVAVTRVYDAEISMRGEVTRSNDAVTRRNNARENNDVTRVINSLATLDLGLERPGFRSSLPHAVFDQ